MNQCRQYFAVRRFRLPCFCMAVQCMSLGQAALLLGAALHELPVYLMHHGTLTSSSPSRLHVFKVLGQLLPLAPHLHITAVPLPHCHCFIAVNSLPLLHCHCFVAIASLPFLFVHPLPSGGRSHASLSTRSSLFPLLLCPLHPARPAPHPHRLPHSLSLSPP